MSAAARLEAGADALGVDLSSQQIDTLLRYIELLVKWNRVYNLTAVRDADAMLSQHLLDSLAVVPHLPEGALLDVGSGAGLPGLPIAIAQPQRAVSVLDSNTKKAAFMRQAAGELGLSNVSVYSHRVEEWLADERFPLIISRAFAELQQFVQWSAPLLAPGGILLAMKGVYPEAEIAALPSPYTAREVIRLEVPGLDAERHLVCIAEAV